MDDFIYKLVKTKLFSFTCPQCHKDYFCQYKRGLARCNECRIKRSFEIQEKKKALKTYRSANPMPSKDISLLVKYVFKNRDLIDFHALISFVYSDYSDRNTFKIDYFKDDPWHSFYFDNLEYMDLDDFIPLLTIKHKHYIYAFIAKFIPNTSIKMINQMCSITHASSWVDKGFNYLRHPRSCRNVFDPYKVQKKDFK